MSGVNNLRVSSFDIASLLRCAVETVSTCRYSTVQLWPFISQLSMVYCDGILLVPSSKMFLCTSANSSLFFRRLRAV